MSSSLLADWQQIRSDFHAICRSIAICVCIKRRICRQSLLICYVNWLAAETEQKLQILFNFCQSADIVCQQTLLFLTAICRHWHQILQTLY